MVFEKKLLDAQFNFRVLIKEYIERRYGEPFKFLFLPKMGLLGSQASTRKKSNYQLWATFELSFQLFKGKKILFFL